MTDNRSSAESGEAQIKRAAQEAAPSAQVVRSDGDLLVYYSGFNLSKFVRFLALQPHVVGADAPAQPPSGVLEELKRDIELRLSSRLQAKGYLIDKINAALVAQPPAAPVETCPVCKGDDQVCVPARDCPRMTAPQSCSAATGDATGWLIEKDDPPVYCVLSEDYDEHWTPDADKALRFARREDAQAYADHIGWTSPPVRIAEHMWPALEPMPRGGMKVDWWEQSVLYRRRLRALIKLVEKEGYSVSSDGRNGTPMALVRTGTEPQSSWQPISTAPDALQGLATVRKEHWGDVVELAGSQEDGSLILFGHHPLTNEVQQWIVIPPLQDNGGPAVSRPHGGGVA